MTQTSFDYTQISTIRTRVVSFVHRSETMMNQEEIRRLQGLEECLKRRDFTVIRRDLALFKGPSTDVDLCFAIGGDGTCLKVAYHLKETPICGINLAPETSVGYLCSIKYFELETFLDAWEANHVRWRLLQRLQCFVNEEALPGPILNEALFCTQMPAGTSVYQLEHRGISEKQSSSGIWISTAAGSSGAMLSAFGEQMPLHDCRFQYMPRELLGVRRDAYQLHGGYFEEREEFTITPLKQGMDLYMDGGITHRTLDAGDRVQFGAHPFGLKRICSF